MASKLYSSSEDLPNLAPVHSLSKYPTKQFEVDVGLKDN